MAAYVYGANRLVAKTHNKMKRVMPYMKVQTHDREQESIIPRELVSGQLATVDSTRFLSAKDGVIGRWMIRQSDPWRVRWDLFVMLCAVYNCFIVPYEIAFMDGAVHIDLLVVAVLVDVVFTFDIFFNFRTTFIDHVTGDEVTDPHKISHHYIKSGHLLLDILATLPFDLFVGAAGFHHSGLKLTTLLKLIHILRLSKIINNIRLSESKKIAIRIAQIVLSVVMYVHCIGCAWAVIVEIKEKWMPQSEGAASDFYETDDKAKKYSFSLYHAVYMWAGVEINPQTSLEMFYLIFVVILGSIIRAVLFGKMAVLMSGLNKDSARISAILGTVNTSMMNMQLPEALQLKIIDYLLSTQATLARQEEFELFMQLIPPTLQTAVGEVIYREIATACPVLKKHPDMFRPLIQKLRIKFVPPETKLISQGEDGNLFFYLVKGLCEVEVCDEQKRPHRVKVLAPGQYFGELALLYNTPRTASVMTICYSTVGELLKEDLMKLLSEFPKAKVMMIKKSENYNDPLKAFIAKSLRQIPYFMKLSERTISTLCYSMSAKNLVAEELLFEKGSICDCLYIVIEGRLNLYFKIRARSMSALLMGHYLANHPETDSMIYAIYPSNLIRNPIKIEGSRSVRADCPIKLECAQVGDVLNASVALVRGDLKVGCKAAEPSTVLCLPTEIIEGLMKNTLILKTQLEFERSKLLKYDEYAGQVIKVVPAIDLITDFPNSTRQGLERAWRNMLGLKNLMVSMTLRKRQAEDVGIRNVKSLVVRLKAVLKAQDAGFKSLSLKIALGEVRPEAVEVLEILAEDEMKIPLLTQFALNVQDLGGLAEHFAIKLGKIADAIEPHQIYFDDIFGDINQMKAICESLVETSALG
jgi:CRP-like cAMP-binding protein